LGEVCTADNCGNKHPKVCSIPAHRKGKVPRSTCKLWHMWVPFAGSGRTQGRTQRNSNKRRNGPTPPSSSNKSKPVKPDWIVKLKMEATAEELRARIRTAQEQGMIMLQGVSYLQVAEWLSPPPIHVPHAPHVNAPPPQQARPAITTVDAIAQIEIILAQMRSQ
jgi:hypothetical protein